MPVQLWRGFPSTRRCRGMMKVEEIRMSGLGNQLYVETSSSTWHFHLCSFTVWPMPCQMPEAGKSHIHLRNFQILQLSENQIYLQNWKEHLLHHCAGFHLPTMGGLDLIVISPRNFKKIPLLYVHIWNYSTIFEVFYSFHLSLYVEASHNMQKYDQKALQSLSNQI